MKEEIREASRIDSARFQAFWFVGRSPKPKARSPNQLPATDRRIPHAQAPQRAGTCASWRFAHAFEQVFQHNGVVVRFILRSVQKRETFFLVRESVQLLQIFFRFRTRQFFQVTFAKERPLSRPLVKPLPQRVRGSKIAEPFLQSDVSFSQAARPQAVDENARSVGARRRFVHSLHGNWHGFATFLYHCKSSGIATVVGNCGEIARKCHEQRCNHRRKISE